MIIRFSYLFFLFVLAAPLSVFAQEDVVEAEVDAVIAAAAAEKAGKEFCVAYSAYDADVPATIGGFGRDLVYVPINVDLETAFGITFPEALESDPKPKVADFEIYSDGRVFFEGEEITQQADAFCAGEKFEPIKSTATFTRGQREVSDVKEEAAKANKEAVRRQEKTQEKDDTIKGQYE